MIVVKLLGGLGNQMFQYAAARGLLKNERQIYVDNHFFDSNQNANYSNMRVYELGIFNNVKVRKIRQWQLALFKNQSLFYKLLRYFLGPSLQYFHHPGADYKPIKYLAESTFLYLDGYFQSYKYFKNSRQDILRDFEFPPLDPSNDGLRKKIQNSINAVSIHIRRGDYLISSALFEKHGVLPLTYYIKAINQLNAEFGSLTLFVFSDDLDWAKENFTLANDIFFIGSNHGGDSWKDMALMSCCKHHIVANSSFSWWGAWLSPSKGQVFAPYNWFNPKIVDYNIHDIIPDSWRILKYD